ncbi:hypothetical protein ACGFNU_21065 [Spirillospora sp. NPDC048911]|uniref:hypothetical protein n=1 Tax=Spirillospora sp. NPDC048911 TaxID=3364527 RepID=UPI003724192F
MKRSTRPPAVDLRQTGPHIIPPTTSLPLFWSAVFILGVIWGTAGAPIYGWPCAVGAGLAGATLLTPYLRRRS